MADTFALTLKAQNAHAANSVTGNVTHQIPDLSPRVSGLKSAVFEITGVSATNTMSIAAAAGDVSTVLAGASAVASTNPVTGATTKFLQYRGLYITVDRADPDVAPTFVQAAVASTSSLAIATGSKIFVVAASLGFLAGQRVRAVSDALATNYMEGVVATYSGTNLTVTVDRISGSSTFADWTITGQICAQVTSTGFGGFTASTVTPLYEDSAFALYHGESRKATQTEALTVSLFGTIGLRVSVLALGA